MLHNLCTKNKHALKQNKGKHMNMEEYTLRGAVFGVLSRFPFHAQIYHNKPFLLYKVRREELTNKL